MLKIKFELKCQLLSLIILTIVVLSPMHALAANLASDNWEIDGFFRNNTGVWTESWSWAPNNDPLATCRNWFRLNLNGKISNSLKLKAEVLAVYEPEYPREEGNDGNIPANYYNSFGFRELRLDWSPKVGHNIRIGRQIVNWGESISARVGDVINPVDARFDLGFTNLEDTRMPIWMIRGLHNFQNINTSIDWIFSPYMQANRYRVARVLASAPFFVDSNGNWNGIAEERFTVDPETRIYKEGYGYLAPSQIVDTGVLGTGVGWAPFNAVMYEDLSGGAGTAFGITGVPNFTLDYPGSKLSDARYGFKTSSTIMGTQTGIYFWRAHVHTPPVLYYQGGIPNVPVAGLTLHNFKAVYERQNVYGFYANKNFDFGVLRMDVAYRPDFEMQTDLISKYPDLVCSKDKLIAQVGYNKDFMFDPLNPYQSFSLTAEYILETYLNNDMDRALLTAAWHEPLKKWSHTLMASLSTNYNFGMYSPSLTVIYNLENNGMVQGAFKYAPDWMNSKWTFEIKYTNVFGGFLSIPYGFLREKDMVVLTTQFSFP